MAQFLGVPGPSQEEFDALSGHIINLGAISSATKEGFIKAVIEAFISLGVTYSPCIIYANWSGSGGNGRHVFTIVNGSTNVVFSYGGASDTGSGSYVTSTQTLSLNSINDKFESGVDAIAAGGSTISFARTHSAQPSAVVATGAGNLDTLASPVITSRTSTGFGVKVFDKTGTDVGGYINWIAIW